jgi:hypothetical protein
MSMLCFVINSFSSDRKEESREPVYVFRFPACYGLHLIDLVTKHPLDFVAHGFVANGTEMDCHSVGGFTDFLYKRVAFVSLRRKKGRASCGGNIGGVFVAHGQLLS